MAKLAAHVTSTVPRVYWTVWWLMRPIRIPAMKTRTSARPGFSLPELLLVLAGVGGLMAMLVAGGAGMAAGAQGSGAAGQVAGAVDRARAQAIASGGFAAFVVAGPEAGDSAWRKVAVFAVREDEDARAAGSELPFVPVDAKSMNGTTPPREKLSPVLPWTELPATQMIFGSMHGAAAVSMADAAAWLAVPGPDSSTPVDCKAVVFDAGGAVVYPAAKSHRVVRLGPSNGTGEAPRLLHPDRADGMPAITIEKFTGRIRITP